MSTGFSLGDHSPAIQDLLAEIDAAAISIDTPERDPTSDSIRRKLVTDLEAASHLSEVADLEPVLDEPQTMDDKLQAIKDFLESEEGAQTCKDTGLDLQVLMESLAPPKKAVQWEDSSPRRSTGRRQAMSMNVLQASAIKQSNHLSVARSGKLHAKQSTMTPEPPGIGVTQLHR